MEPYYYIDRISGEKEVEETYGAKALNIIYGKDLVSCIIGPLLLHTLVKFSFFSSLYGKWQSLPISKKKIKPFINHFNVDETEFLEPASTYQSFNDFFIRKLKKEARPIFQEEKVAIIPADGRYLFFDNIAKTDGFFVKGEKFDLKELLQNEVLAKDYENGSMVIARLCPTDYHRFHFPCDAIVGPTSLINGYLYSVNPIALKKDIHIFTKNKRTLCSLNTPYFGEVLYLEIGATNVGSIVETYDANQFYKKGAEKGYFSFGGSSLILLFKPNTIQFDKDLLKASNEGFEIRCLMGQSMGCSLSY